LAQTVTETAERLGIAKLVEVKRTVRVVDPQAKYLGQWDATKGSVAIRFVIAPGRKVRAVRISEGQETHQSVGHWSLEDEQINLVIENDTVTGTIDEAGNLVVHADGEVITFERVDD
jgi:hypothetical protein